MSETPTFDDIPETQYGEVPVLTEEQIAEQRAYWERLRAQKNTYPLES